MPLLIEGCVFDIIFKIIKSITCLVVHLHKDVLYDFGEATLTFIFYQRDQQSILSS